METTENRIILPTAYMPNLQYFTKLQSKRVILEQHENYVKQSYRNRCEILTANGVMPLIIPIKHTSAKIKIRDVKIDYTESWQKIHWRAINAAYRSSPFFEYYADDFRPFFEKEEEFLFDFNLKILDLLMELTGLKTEIILSDSYIALSPEQANTQDYRVSITPKTNKPADTRFKPAPYYQVFGNRTDFSPNLSILDLLCNEGNNSYSIILKSYEF